MSGLAREHLLGAMQPIIAHFFDNSILKNNLLHEKKAGI